MRTLLENYRGSKIEECYTIDANFKKRRTFVVTNLKTYGTAYFFSFRKALKLAELEEEIRLESNYEVG